ncbi:siaz-interacting nuclear protein isoform X1 [Ictalurus punctatus]|uniref:Siaz-interacting nuclear protein isoform X1 n=1 Tax=Ictalurus punctatus TaxID=7998 RepID=A0A2D0SLK3_ICTPU|nr:siaz-interacting nuclear protein isoform X1 [Ictalurus punctatus]XP_053542173.1 siaz-interacting nuclear protein isoform X1 [Ictalurus punctatus]XP_053542174.1 siaz-interacting nuclear protein isoform X1 [Ictalurus punctatus]
MAGNVAENTAVLDAGDAVGFAEQENAGTTGLLRPKFQWDNKPCLKIAAVRPLPRSSSSEMSQNRPQSPAQTSSFSPARISPGMSSSPIRDNVDQRSRPTFRWNCTRQCPFSFDLRDSRRRVAREQELEYLRLMAESRLAVVGFSADFTFRANPVRKYKPLILEQSTRPLTIPKSPFSSRYTRK